MTTLRRAIVLLTTAGLGGCILLIDPIEAGDHCGIEGGGACAECIRKSCQAPIDRCCANVACTGSPMLGGIDACGRGETAECADILSAGRIEKEEESVRSCAAASCGALCTQGSTGTGAKSRPKWTCTTSRDTPNDCATCIYQGCMSIIETCCTETSCRNDTTIQTDMGACVSGDQPGCAYLLDEDRSTSGQAGVLRKCIEQKCAPRCMGNGLPHTKCTLLSGGDYCQCTNEEVAGTQTCRKETVDGDCVLGKGGCSCGQYACTDDTLGCSCSFRGGVVGTSCTAATDKVCCAKQSEYGIECECKFSACYPSSDEAEVPSCSRADVLNYAGGAAVDSCSR
jgi:hypothetical protein